MTAGDASHWCLLSRSPHARSLRERLPCRTARPDGRHASTAIQPWHSARRWDCAWRRRRLLQSAATVGCGRIPRHRSVSGSASEWSVAKHTTRWIRGHSGSRRRLHASRTAVRPTACSRTATRSTGSSRWWRPGVYPAASPACGDSQCSSRAGSRPPVIAHTRGAAPSRGRCSTRCAGCCEARDWFRGEARVRESTRGFHRFVTRRSSTHKLTVACWRRQLFRSRR
jgi:hypothetical protein